MPEQGEALSGLGSCTASCLCVSCSNSAPCLFLWETYQGHSTWSRKGRNEACAADAAPQEAFYLVNMKSGMMCLCSQTGILGASFQILHFLNKPGVCNSFITASSDAAHRVQQVHIKLWSLCCSPSHLLCFPSVVPLMTM